MSADNQFIIVKPGKPPTNPYCPPDYATVFQDVINQAAFISLLGFSYYIGETDPGTPPSQGPYVWINTNAAPDTGALMGIYTWSFGLSRWLRQHDVPANSSERHLWVGLESDLVTYDGGDSNPLGPDSGPMWQVDHTFDNKTLIGVGQLSVSLKTINVTDTGGTDQQLVVNAQTPQHVHHYHMLKGNADGNDTLTDEGIMFGHSAGGGSIGTYNVVTDRPDNFISPAVQAPLNVMNPYYGTFVIMRTPRIYYAA